MTNVDGVIEAIARKQASFSSEQSAMLVAISGIDGCGKGYLTEKIAECLSQMGLRVASISVDGWLNLPHQRFHQTNPAEHFYHHAIRFDELFQQLIFPLRRDRSINLDANYTEETAVEYRRHTYQFEEIEIILLEGIYLLKRPFQTDYDLSIWVDCSFETALERAIARAQEGLPPEETITAYHTIYFPAQTIHFERDRPQSAATFILQNDPNLVHDEKNG